MRIPATPQRGRWSGCLDEADMSIVRHVTLASAASALPTPVRPNRKYTFTEDRKTQSTNQLSEVTATTGCAAEVQWSTNVNGTHTTITEILSEVKKTKTEYDERLGSLL